MRSEKPHHNHPSALVGPSCTCIFPPQGLAVKMQGRGSILQKFDAPASRVEDGGQMGDGRGSCAPPPPHPTRATKPRPLDQGK
eukprot:COSAG05_NODE_653_length_8071_cov_220.994982_6_plen_83_part_00